MAHHASAKIGRNDTCPCGSGKKYKLCCLPGYTPSIDHVWARQHQESERLTREITRFALRKFGERIDEAWKLFVIRMARKWWKPCFSIGSGALPGTFPPIRFVPTSARFAVCQTLLLGCPEPNARFHIGAGARAERARR